MKTMRTPSARHQYGWILISSAPPVGPPPHERLRHRHPRIPATAGKTMNQLPVIATFDKAHHPTRKLLVVGQGIPIAEFLQAPASHWIGESPTS